MNKNLDVGWVIRTAKLFEAGVYADKGVTATVEDLATLAMKFNGPVPVWVEHADSPLKLGELASVAAIGGELFGTLRFPPEAHALIERSGAKSLSVGFAADMGAILEVSLVRNPRVASARIFSEGSVVFEGRLDEGSPSSEVAGWVREGRLSPAQAPFARALLSGNDAAAARELIRRGPERELFTRTTPPPHDPEADAALLTFSEAEFYRRHFPDVPLALIASR
ncbi:hypothetical protein BH11ARM2_BH11ARM2_25110 [soil metagenome]